MADLILGRNAVLEALKSGRNIDKTTLQKTDGPVARPIREILTRAKERKIPVYYSDKAHMDKTPNHQGVIAVASDFEYCQISDMLKRAEERGEKPLLVVLDGIEDPHNLGAIMRTAECAGAHGIIIPKRHSVSVNETVLKTSAGAAEYMLCARVTNIANTIDELKEAGLWIYACDMGDRLIYDQDLKGPVAVVVGSEGFGISRLVKEKCDFVVSIPMSGNINSLNASNAAAIFLYEAVRQRLG